MSDHSRRQCTVFDGVRRVATGPLPEVALAFKRAVEKGAGDVFLFDDATGRAFDIDIRGTTEAVVARLGPATEAEQRGPGRPRLGVVAREVTLLPGQWEWLAAQPGGASVTLRKLVESARRGSAAKARAARDAAYHFMHAMAGDRAGFEEATRALFAGDQARFEALIKPWPKDVREHAARLAFPER
jgi:hypothetical protein